MPGRSKSVASSTPARSDRCARWTPEEELAAFECFARHPDKVYSFVDCVSFAVMEKLAIQAAWSVDSDFSHRFTAVPGPVPCAFGGTGQDPEAKGPRSISSRTVAGGERTPLTGEHEGSG